MGGKNAPLQAGGSNAGLRVLKAKVCLKNIITTPELPGRGGEFYINTVNNNPYIPGQGFFSNKIQISAVRVILTILLLSSLRK